jgi:hypothetical protein
VLYPEHIGKAKAFLAKRQQLAYGMHYAGVRKYRQKAMGEALLH